MALLEERKRKFAGEGLFAEERKKARPFLPQLSFFDGFDAAEIDELLAMGSLLELPRGHALFHVGQPTSALGGSRTRRRVRAILGTASVLWSHGVAAPLQAAHIGVRACARLLRSVGAPLLTLTCPSNHRACGGGGLGLVAPVLLLGLVR